MLASCACPSAFSSGSGSLNVAQARPVKTDTFNGMGGASMKLLTGASRARRRSVEPPSARAAAFLKVSTVDGRLRIGCATCCASLARAPHSISLSPSANAFWRVEARGTTLRGSGPVSRTMRASATAACPSIAAWCSCVYRTTRLWPLAAGARPCRTCNFDSGRLRSRSTGCNASTCASSSTCPSPRRADSAARSRRCAPPGQARRRPTPGSLG